ncbi:TonB family protein [Luteimonas lutimaris]|uniref:TonB C-terminal domain-containing protein n=1 Tax=Luteimonas lutimaris TaxID=698645 RepID=A0ABP7MT93_9GAMM
MSVLSILIVVAGATGGVLPDSTCNGLDPELVHCPSPEAPRVAELGSGKVTVELEIDVDGYVRSSKIVSSSGHPAWPGAAQAAVAKWRYSAGSAPRTRVVPFDFQLGEP